MSNKCPKCQFENTSDSKFCKECGTQILSPKDIEVTETLETPKEELTTGSIFAGRYQIIEELGKGGMGRVYRVLDKELKEEVALKLIKPEIAKDQKTIERFKNELKIARRVSHRNVGRMYELMEDREAHFITMEYVPGQDLRGLIRQTGQLTADKAISIAMEICAGLDEAHNQGVIHRDLKPSNIIIDKNGNARIMDFGIARTRESAELTGSGMIIGTPKYISPEQAEGKAVDHLSDIYSLGIILYEMVTGRVPFEGDTAISVAHKHKYEAPQEPKSINAQIPEDLNRLILNILEKDKQKRIRSASDVYSELLAIKEGMPTTQKELPERKPITSKEITVAFALKRLRFPALIAVTLLIFAVIVWQLLKSGGTDISDAAKPSIAVISFENQTGDESYDRLRKIIPNLLITSLEQSGNFHVITWERMYDLLKQVGREDTEIIDRDLGFELCRLDSIDYIVIGSVTKLGNIFATDVKILDVQSKVLLRSASSRGESESSILENQIDELNGEISKGMGLSERKISAARRRITEFTTTSMNAYNDFLEGREQYERYYYEDARESLENAIHIDPNFAVAYLWLAQVHGKLGNAKARAEAQQKAKILAENVNEKDKLYIYALHAQNIEKDEEKRIRILKEIARKYPKEKRAHYNLGIHHWNKKEFPEAVDEYSKALALDPNYGSALNGLGYTYADMGNFEKAIEYFEKYATLTPGDANPLDSLAEIYFQIGRLDDSRKKYQQAIDVQSDYFEAYWRIAYVYALTEDYQGALEWIKHLIDEASSPGILAEAYLWQAFYHYWIGEVNQSRYALRLTLEEAESVENKFAQAYAAWIEGWINYGIGNMEVSRELFQRWIDLFKDYPHTYRPSPSQQLYSAEFLFFLGLLDIRQGRTDSAESRLTEMEALLPEISPVFKNRITSSDFHLLNGELLLAKGSLEEAISVFEEEFPLDIPYMHSWLLLLYNTPYPRDVLARIYQKQGAQDQAIAEYERLIKFNPDSKDRSLIHPLHYYRLAKLCEQRGWKGKAIEHYEKFLTLWHSADPGTPEVEDAKKRLASLQGP